MDNSTNTKKPTNVEITSELLQRSAELRKKNKKTNEKLEELKSEINKLTLPKDKP